jgi:hypothetical protein
MSAQYLERADRDLWEGHGTGQDALQGIALFFAAPFIGLVYLVTYAFIGVGAVLCYGLKAFGIQCGVFKA